MHYTCHDCHYFYEKTKDGHNKAILSTQVRLRGLKAAVWEFGVFVY